MELSITTLNQIINNFDLQARLYGKMAELARVQLENLKDRSYSACIDEVNRILAERKAIMIELIPLNEENKKLQRDVRGELRIESFSIKNLKGKIGEDELTRLKVAINVVQKFLKAIDQADRESEAIMRRNASGKAAGKTATSQQAAKAYIQAKQQGKLN